MQSVMYLLALVTGAQPFAFAPPAGYTAVAAAWSTQLEVPAVDTQELLAAVAVAAQDDAVSTVASELSFASDATAAAAATPAAAAVVASSGSNGSSSSSSSNDKAAAATSSSSGSAQAQCVEVVGNLRVPPPGPIDLSLYTTASDLHMFGLER
jgi:hypothetical protein